MKKVLTAVPLLIMISIFAKAQLNTAGYRPATLPIQDTIPAKIVWTIENDGTHFSAKLRPLRQVAGAPPCFYSYFWEFGDGAFSFEESPIHMYKDAGSYQVRLYATNNHDDGAAPPTVPYTVKIERQQLQAGTNKRSDFFDGQNQNLKLAINRDPKPGEDFVTIIGYRNNLTTDFSGTIAFFFNEQEISSKSFSLKEKRGYNGEEGTSINKLWMQLAANTTDSKDVLTKIPDNDHKYLSAPDTEKDLLEAQASSEGVNIEDAAAYNNSFLIDYRSKTRAMLKLMKETYSMDTFFHFNSLSKFDDCFLFISMNTLPEMIRDTNTTVTITAMMIPDDPLLQPETVNLNMEIVASHDPNKLLIKNNHMSYRFFGKKKELTYEVHFQNTGKGPTKKVAIGFATPKLLNASSLKVKGIKPYCDWCDSAAYSGQSCIDTIHTADSIYFVFNNIYLPGMQQRLVKNKDSTKGLVQYSIRFKSKPKKKIPFATRASIVFDRNEPIYTNKATAKFAKGFSPGIMAGYNLMPSSGNYSGNGPIQIGFTLAPYAPSRPYFQVEFHGGIAQNIDSTSGVVDYFNIKDTAINNAYFGSYGLEKNSSKRQSSIQLVPLNYRYNISNWVGVGVGVTATILISEERTTEEKIYFNLLDGSGPDTLVLTSSSTSKVSMNDLWAEAKIAPFLDIQFGKVKTTGPAIGLRYTRQLRGNLKNQFLLYAAFKL